MNETYKKITVLSFFAILIVLSIATLLLPKRDVSELENRELQHAPTFSVDSLINKKFMEDGEKFLADHMVFRSNLVTAKTQLELLMGKRLINGVFITDNMLLENIEKGNDKITADNADAINKFAQKYKGKLSTSIMLVPTASEIYKSELPPLAQQFDQTAYIKEFYKKLTLTGGVDVYSPFSANVGNYIYYKTDHHWTSLGAYTGYNALAKSLGFKPVGIDLFEVEHASHDFLGTLYSKVAYGETLKDGIDLYHYKKDNIVTDVVRYTSKNTQTFPTIFFKENLGTKDKYRVFLDENTGVLKIKTNLGNGKRLIVFKDSYAHALMQFLPLHYEEITLIDTRYLNEPLDKYVDLKSYQQALFLYNVGGFMGDATVKKVTLY